MNLPVPRTKAELLRALDEMRSGVQTGDTLEGSIEFTLPTEEDQAGPEEWMVRASYRINNLLGQGGVRMIGAIDGDATHVRTVGDTIICPPELMEALKRRGGTLRIPFTRLIREVLEGAALDYDGRTCGGPDGHVLPIGRPPSGESWPCECGAVRIDSGGGVTLESTPRDAT